jgi:hypothetical protein
MVAIGCWNGSNTVRLTSFRNPLWYLYATETNPAKGPLPVTVKASSTESSTSSSAEPIVTASPKVQQNGITMPIGAIAGIAIGCIVAIVVGIIVVIAFRSKIRRPNNGQDVLPPFHTKEMEPSSPAPVYTHAAVYPSPPQSAYQAGQAPGGGTWEADSGLRIDTNAVWHGARQN